MSSPNLSLTLSGRRFSITPLPGHIVSSCTADGACENSATHRLLSRTVSPVKLLCDTHTLDWARQHGHSITTARDVIAVNQGRAS
jgi:hypothetical protein